MSYGSESLCKGDQPLERKEPAEESEEPAKERH